MRDGQRFFRFNVRCRQKRFVRGERSEVIGRSNRWIYMLVSGGFVAVFMGFILGDLSSILFL